MTWLDKPLERPGLIPQLTLTWEGSWIWWPLEGPSKLTYPVIIEQMKLSWSWAFPAASLRGVWLFACIEQTDPLYLDLRICWRFSSKLPANVFQGRVSPPKTLCTKWKMKEYWDFLPRSNSYGSLQVNLSLHWANTGLEFREVLFSLWFTSRS